MRGTLTTEEKEYMRDMDTVKNSGIYGVPLVYAT